MQEKKKILIFIDWFLPGYKAGGPVRSMANMVEYLGDRYDFYIYTGNKDHDGTVLDVEHNQWIDFNGKAKVYYTSHSSFGEVKEIIKEVSPGMIYLNSIFSIGFTIFPLVCNRLFFNRIGKLIVAPRGMFQKGALKLKGKKKRFFLSLVKPLFMRVSNIRWHATDMQEKQDIIDEIGKIADIQIVGNIPTISHTIKEQTELKEPIRFVTISLVAEKKNHLFFIKLLNNLETEKELVYTIYGPIKDKEYWAECQREIKNLPQNIKVNYMGSVTPLEVGERLRENDFFVLPTFGENFGHAIYEAFTNGVPVLISDQTPWINLEDRNAGWSIPLNNSDKWEAVVSNILLGEINYIDVVKGARKLAEEYLEDNDFIDSYRRLLE